MNDEDWKKMLSLAMDKLYDKAHTLEGQVSGEHGIGLVKKGYLWQSLPAEAIALMKGIKKAFDPNNILNPGKVCQ